MMNVVPLDSVLREGGRVVDPECARFPKKVR